MTQASSSAFVADVYELARVGSVIEGDVPFASAARLGASLRDDSGAIGFRFQASHDARGRPGARLSLRTDLPLTCDRCGQLLMLHLEHEATYYFVPDEKELAALPVDVDEEAEPLVGDRRFDVAALVEDETLLCIPLSPRHERCPGGAHDAETEAREERSNPFAGLQSLLRDKRR